MDQTLAISIFLALAVAALAAVLVWQKRRSAALSSAAIELDQILRTGRFAARIPAGNGAHDLAGTANRLLEHIAVRDLQIKERERTFNGLLSGLHEAVAVHRENLIFANSRFVALVGARNVSELIGRPLADIVPRDY